MNHDPFPQDVIVTGLDWVDIPDMRPIAEPRGDVARQRDGWITELAAYEARVYVTV